MQNYFSNGNSSCFAVRAGYLLLVHPTVEDFTTVAASETAECIDHDAIGNGPFLGCEHHLGRCELQSEEPLKIPTARFWHLMQCPVLADMFVSCPC